MSEQDEYKLSSGLPLDDVDGTITAMEFGYNAKIGAGVICANITVTDDEGTEIEQSFSVGDGWEIVDDGEGIAPESGGVKSLSARSNYGRLIESMVKCAGADVLRELAPTPKRVDGYVGTMWHFGTVPVLGSNPNAKDEAEKVRDKFITTAYLGIAGKKKAKKEAAAPATDKASNKAKVAAKEAATESPLQAADAELWDKLLALANAADTHAEFMAEALELDEVDGNAIATTAIVSRKAGSVWAAKE